VCGFCLPSRKTFLSRGTESSSIGASAIDGNPTAKSPRQRQHKCSRLIPRNRSFVDESHAPRVFGTLASQTVDGALGDRVGQGADTALSGLRCGRAQHDF
jgi:hypothetical protein